MNHKLWLLNMRWYHWNSIEEWLNDRNIQWVVIYNLLDRRNNQELLRLLNDNNISAEFQLAWSELIVDTYESR